MPYNIWDDFIDSIPNFSMDAFESVDPFTWPLIVVGIIGFIYATSHSVTVAVVGILITLASFVGTTTIFTDIPALTQFLYIIAVIGIALLLTTVIIKRRS